MTWVYFEDSDRQTAAPAFTLERTGGGRISLYDYYERSSLVVLFPSGRADDAVKPDSQEALQRFAARLEEIEREGAEVVAVLPDMALALDSPGCENALPFPLLADHGGRVREKYAGLMVAELVLPGSALLYVLDVYGVPWAAYVGERLDEDSLVDEVLSWLVFIGVQCPE